MEMERLTTDLCLKIFCFLDYVTLATANQVCRNWKALASENTVWLKLFKDRWGEDSAEFYEPEGSTKSWKQVYEVQDRCDRVGLGLKIIREGEYYYLVHKGEIQKHLGSKRARIDDDSGRSSNAEQEESQQHGILDKILFFIGDLEVASSNAKRGRLV